MFSDICRRVCFRRYGPMDPCERMASFSPLTFFFFFLLFFAFAPSSSDKSKPCLTLSLCSLSHSFHAMFPFCHILFAGDHLHLLNMCVCVCVTVDCVMKASQICRCFCACLCMSSSPLSITRMGPLRKTARDECKHRADECKPMLCKPVLFSCVCI